MLFLELCNAFDFIISNTKIFRSFFAAERQNKFNYFTSECKDIFEAEDARPGKKRDQYSI